MNKLAKILTGTVLAVSATLANANLIQGGGFNSATDLADNWTVTSTNSGSATVQLGSAFSLGPQEGAGYLAFTGNLVNPSSPSATVTQLISGLVIGDIYSFSYQFGGRGGQNNSNPILTAGLSSGTNVIGDLFSQSDVTNTAVGVWTLVTTSFQATTNSVLVSFQETSTNSRSVGPAVDSVSLTNLSAVNVSSPSAIALLSLGIIAVFMRRK